MIASELKPEGSKNSEWNSIRLEYTHLTTRGLRVRRSFVPSEATRSSGQFQGVITPGLISLISSLHLYQEHFQRPPQT